MGRMKFLKRMRITVLKPWLREVSYEKGAVIVQQGNMPSKVIYVTKGSCIAYFRGKHSQKVIFIVVLWYLIFGP